MRYVIDSKVGGNLAASFETGDAASALAYLHQSLVDIGVGNHRAVAAAKIALDKGDAVYFNDDFSESVEFTITK